MSQPYPLVSSVSPIHSRATIFSIIDKHPIHYPSSHYFLSLMLMATIYPYAISDDCLLLRVCVPCHLLHTQVTPICVPVLHNGSIHKRCPKLRLQTSPPAICQCLLSSPCNGDHIYYLLCLSSILTPTPTTDLTWTMCPWDTP